MKAPDFTYVRAATLDDAFCAKAEHGPESRWLAGGQSLLASLAFRLSEPPALIDISRIEALRGIAFDGAMLRIGAATTHTALGASDIVAKHAPLLAQAVPKIAHMAVRNRGTIGGSLGFADPAAELPACCVALDATIVTASATGERRIAARDFWQGVYATALDQSELITAIEVPAMRTGEHHVLYEVSRRAGDYAMAGVATVLRTTANSIEGARLVFFALGDRPVVAGAAARELIGHALDTATIEAACKALSSDLDPAGDLNGGVETKRHLAKVVLGRALAQLLASMKAS